MQIWTQPSISLTFPTQKYTECADLTWFLYKKRFQTSYLSPTPPVAAAHHFPLSQCMLLRPSCRLQLREIEIQSVLLKGKRRRDLQLFSPFPRAIKAIADKVMWNILLQKKKKKKNSCERERGRHVIWRVVKGRERDFAGVCSLSRRNDHLKCVLFFLTFFF